MVIDLAGIEILVSDLAGGDPIVAHVARGIEPGVRQRPEGKIRSHRRIDVSRCPWRERRCARCCEGTRSTLETPSDLPQTLIVKEEKCLVVDNRSAHRAAELIAPEGCDRWAIEVVSCIKCAVADELVGATMKLVGAGAGDGVDDAAGGLAVFGGIVRGNDREFLHGIDPVIVPSTPPGAPLV